MPKTIFTQFDAHRYFVAWRMSKADIITQPAAPNTTTSAVAQPTFNAESFSTNGLTIVEGTDYIKLAKPQPVAVAGKSEVIEFFWYGCGHCYTIEPAVKA